MQKWDPGFANRLPLYEPLRGYAAMLAGTDWPNLYQLQRMIDTRRIVTGGGKPLRVIEQDAKTDALEDRYEARVYLRGELQIRQCNWHDLFNLLVWAAFPCAKTALNARHYRAMFNEHAHSRQNRGPAQDALTLFDEGGVIVVSRARELLDDLRKFRWKQLFWQQRQQVRQQMRWYLFGHATYEKLLDPFDGITARGVMFEVDDAWLALPPTAQLESIDERLALCFADMSHFQATRDLAPVPILGIPDWWPKNDCEHYYDNTNYFRSGRTRGRIQAA
jgi:hypothetical protein